MKKLLVILGLTATGKTDLALDLAKKYNGELVSADSRQVYKGLDIGTGKLPGVDVKVKKGNGFWEMDGIKVWMYDVVGPKDQYTVNDYVEQAERVVENIIQKGKLPIIVGGTGLYLKALLEGFPNLEVPVDERLRGELQSFSTKELQEKLTALSPAAFEKLNNSDRHNPRRLLRSIELVIMNPYRTTNNKKQAISNKFKVLKIGLTAPRLTIQERIYQRLISRINQDMIGEAERLQSEGVSTSRMRDFGLEYGALADCLDKKLTKEQLVAILKIRIGQFAKRQETWFKKEREVYWFDITERGWSNQVEKQVKIWYDSGKEGARTIK